MKKKKHNGVIYLIAILIYFSLAAGFQYSISEDSSADEISTPKLSDFGELNPRAPVETIQLGQLIGEWDCISGDLVGAGTDSAQWYTNKATWRWEYILGGHAVLNNWWQEDNSPAPITKEYFAAGIFIFNPKTTLWEATIMNSRPHKISPKFQLQYKDEKLQMHDGSGKWLVTFFNIRKDSFEWKYEILTEADQWKSISKITAQRKMQIPN